MKNSQKFDRLKNDNIIPRIFRKLNDNQKGFYNVGDLDFALNVSEFVTLSISNAMSY